MTPFGLSGGDHDSKIDEEVSVTYVGGAKLLGAVNTNNLLFTVLNSHI
jgi:hypothetical protein